MDQLQAWMAARSENDHTLAPRVGVSRVQISRIRRGVTGASKPTAMRLQEVTGIPWYRFIDPKADGSQAEAA